ncbi:MAG: NUDIX hydrolase [Pseudomonadota bacterium]
MSKQRYAVQHLRRIFEGFVNLDQYELTVTRGTERLTAVREVHDHGNGAAVLPVDPERRTALLVRQVRTPVHIAGHDGRILEAAAGVIDPEDDGPEAAAIREGREELGYHVHNLTHVSTFFPIPGAVTEQMSCFHATYGPGDKIAGAREADDDELIDVEEWPLDALWAAYKSGTLTDGKAIVCLLGLRLDRPELFDDQAGTKS